MATIPVSKVKKWRDIERSRNNQHGEPPFFPKDKLLTQRDIDILKAFLIPTVSIVSKEKDSEVPEEPNASNDPPGANVPSFDTEYENMVQLLKKSIPHQRHKFCRENFYPRFAHPDGCFASTYRFL